ncbi:MAG: DUF6044 family protein [Ferruginibacter sp.]
MKFSQKHSAYYILMGLLCLYFFPFIIYGQQSILPVVDNMDCFDVWNKLVAETTPVFAAPNTIIPAFMGGVPRFTLVNSYSPFFFLNVLLPSFYAILVHMILIHSLSCFGMYQLANKYLTKGNQIAAIIAAIIFGFRFPVYAYGLSIALIPFLAMSFIRFYKNQTTFKDWLLIVMYPFASNLQSVGIFVLGAWIMVVFILMIKDKQLHIQMLYPLLVLIPLYYLNNYPTIHNLIFNDYFFSHRHDFKQTTTSIASNQPFELLQQDSIEIYFAWMKRFLYVMIACCIIHMYRKKFSGLKWVIVLGLILVFLKGIHFVLLHEDFETIRQKVSLLKMFHFEKILFWIYPLRAAFIAVLLTYVFSLFKNKWIAFASLSITCITLFVFTLHWKPLLGLPWQKTGRPFSNFYATDLFDTIKNTIGKPNNAYRVASFGIHPAVAQYNGMYTVDGYLNNYPLQYKQQFRKVIETDLKLIHAQIGYTAWDFETVGHRCYLQNLAYNKQSNLQLPADKLNPLSSPQTVHWNFDALKNLGCNYIISTVALQPTTENAIQLIITTENSMYKLFLYQLL